MMSYMGVSDSMATQPRVERILGKGLLLDTEAHLDVY